MNQSLLKLSFCLFFLMLYVTPSLYAQSPTISVEFKNTPPSKAMETIEFNSSYRFVYKEGLGLSKPLINLSRKDADIDEVLKQMALQTGLKFQRNGMNIAVSQGETSDTGGQTGKGQVSGKVVDEIGQSALGATIQAFPGNHYAVTDNNGDFSIELSTGTYILEIKMMSYQTYRVEGVEIKKGKTIPLSVSLIPSTEALEQVVIITEYNPETSSVAGFLTMQKNAAVVSDGISAEQISRAPGSSATDALKRITGVTTIGETVVVRNLGNRWNNASLDGVALPSTDPNEQAFSFNLIPTNIIDNITVSKTITPDMRASFVGGYVQVTTKDIPDENFNSIKVGGAYYDRATFKDRFTKQRGDHDYFGYDDGSRDYPTGLTGADLKVTANQAFYFNDGSEKFTNDNFSTYQTETQPSANYQIALGRAYNLKENGNGGRNRFGFLGVLSLRNEQNQLDIEHTQRGNWFLNTNIKLGDAPDSEIPSYTEYGFTNNGAQYNYVSTLNGLLNFGLQLGKTRLSLRNTYTHIFDNRLVRITGFHGVANNTGFITHERLPITRETNIPLYQSFLQNKLAGSHVFRDFTLDWDLARTSIERDQKDITYLEYQRFYAGYGAGSFPPSIAERKKNDVITRPYTIVFGGDGIIFPFGRANYAYSETAYNFGASLSYDLNLDNFKNRFKIGYFGAEKKALRDDATASLQHNKSIDPYIEQPLSKFLENIEYGPEGYGWLAYLYEDPYEGRASQHSGYLMLDNRFGGFARLVWGGRAEFYEYREISQLDLPAGTTEDYTVEQKDEKKWWFLPSANLTLTPVENFNIRLAYGRSVIRPQFNERVNQYFYDPILEGYRLNSGVVSSVADNYDFKLEYYPSAGEILSAGLFYKKITDPIELAITSNPGSTNVNYETINSEEAGIFGLELNFRRNFGFLGEGEALNDLYVFGNAFINIENQVIQSAKLDEDGNIAYSDEEDFTVVTFEVDRPLYGQSPYAYNLGTGYQGNRFGFQVTHNKTGRKYLVVSNEIGLEELQRPYVQTDLQVSWKFLKDHNLKLTLSLTNAFDEPIVYYNNLNSKTNRDLGDTPNPRDEYELRPGASEDYDENLDEITFKAFRGRKYSVSLSYAF